MRKILYLIFVLIASILDFNLVSAAPATHLVISEIQTTGGTGYTTDEFVELYNPTESDMNLSGWKLAKKTASGKEYVLADNFGDKVIKSHSFFLIVHPAGYLGETQPDFYYTTTNSISDNNTVILYDNSGLVVDKVGFGTTIDFEGEATSNPSAKKSIERKAKSDSTVETMIEGGGHYFLGNSEDTDNNKQDFIIRSVSEPQNSQSEQEYLDIVVPEIPQQPENNNEQGKEEPKNDEPQTTGPVVYSDKIIVNEFFPNPEGADDGEFIELKNISEVDIDLVDWMLGDNSTRKYTIKSGDFKSTIIKAGGYFVIDKKISKISLNNTSDSVKLYQPNNNLLVKVEYKDCREGESYNLIDGKWIWSDEITPGKENIFVIKNEPPSAEANFPKEAKVRQKIVFNASESSDPDGDKLQYFWDFGDGHSSKGEEVKYTYQKAGSYTVILKVIDAKGSEDKAENKIIISDYDYSSKIVINELLPAPKGDDNELEWIELFNPENRDVNLEGWQLTNQKKFYTFPENKIIKANDYLVIKRKDSKISLKDSGDKLFLIDPAKKIVNGVEYKSAKEDLAFARQNMINWSWTEKPTPGEENEIVMDETDDGKQAATGNTEATGKNEVANTIPIELKIADVNESYLKKLVTITGEVDRTSGNNIYLTDEDGSNLRAYIQASTGIKKPELKQGDNLKVTGILDKTTAGLRLLPRTESDLEIQKSGQVLGASAEKDVVSVPSNNNTNQIELYLLIAGGALLIVLTGLGAKYYLNKRKKTSN